GCNSGWFSAGDDLHQIKISGRVLLELLHHAFEHVEGLTLVLDKRILLTVPTQTDSFLEVVHVQQVIFPKLVEHAQHDHALVIAHSIGANQLFLCVIARLQFFEYGIAEFLTVEGFRLDALGKNIYAKASKDRIFQPFDVPIGGVRFYRRVLFEQIAQDAGDIIFDDEIFLIDTFEQAAAQAIDGFALLVHDIDVLQQVFSRLEVLGFDGFLSLLNAAADEPRLNGHALFHSEFLQQA